MPSKRSTPRIMHRAGELRTPALAGGAREEPSAAEAKLWAYLRTLQEDGIHFRRQHAIGTYIADFCAPSRKLIIEVDGNQHLEQEEYDTERTAFLKSKGYRVLRFWNTEVMNKIKDVMGVILEELERLNL